MFIILKMISKKNYLLLGISFYSIFSFAQTIDSDLLSQLSDEEILAAREVLESENFAKLEYEELPEIKESLLEEEPVDADEIVYDKYGLRKGGYLHLFKNSKEIRNYFKKNFKIIEIGKQKISFGHLNESFYIIILKKN